MTWFDEQLARMPWYWRIYLTHRLWRVTDALRYPLDWILDRPFWRMGEDAEHTRLIRCRSGEDVTETLGTE